MRIGFIGAGTVAKTIAKHALAAGHQVVLSNSRGPETLAELVAELGPGASAATAKEAAGEELVVLASSWPNVQPALFSVADWSGKVLVDATNRVAGYQPFTLGEISGRTSSEVVADLAPGAKVVKAFNSVPMAWISDFSKEKPNTVLFVSGDDDSAKKTVSDLIEQMGFSPIDIGSLAVGGRLQQLGGPLAGVNLVLTERFTLPSG